MSDTAPSARPAALRGPGSLPALRRSDAGTQPSACARGPPPGSTRRPPPARAPPPASRSAWTRPFTTHLEDTVTDRNDHHASSLDVLDRRFSRGGCSRAPPPSASACPRSWPRPAAAARAPARPPSTRSVGAPRRGGTLRVGFVGAGTAETVDPFIGVTPIDQGRIQNLYDPLVIVEPRPVDVARPGARVEPERRRDGLRGQAAPRRHLPQRQVVRRRRRHLLDPADGEARELRLATVRRPASTSAN